MPTDWQDIESAPKDGTLIWIYDDLNIRSIAYWHQAWSWRKFKVEKFFVPLWGDAEGPHDGCEINVTHWQPLPEPPTPVGSE